MSTEKKTMLDKEWPSPWYTPKDYDKKHPDGKTVAFIVRFHANDTFYDVETAIDERFDTLQEAREAMHGALVEFLDRFFPEFYKFKDKDDHEDDLFELYFNIDTMPWGKLRRAVRSSPSRTAGILRDFKGSVLVDCKFDGGIFELKCKA